MATMTTTVQRRAFCSSCVLDIDVDPQTGRCLTCGYQAVKKGGDPPSIATNGVVHNALPRAHAAAGVAAPFDPKRSVALLGLNKVEQQPPSAPPLAIEVAPERLAAIVERGDEISRSHGVDLSEEDHPPKRWIDDTRALIAGLQERAAAADRRQEDAQAAAKVAADEAARHRKRARSFSLMLQQLGIEDPEAAAPVQGTSVAAATRWSGKSSVQVDACIDCGKSDTPHCANGRCRSCDGRWRAGKVS